jgi:hypothetical protein
MVAMTVKVSMNMDDLTFGEMELFEEVTGLIMSDAIKTEIVRDPKTGMPLPDPDDPKGRPLKETKMGVKAMMGMVYIAMRRDNPDVTFEDVRTLKLSEVDMDLREDADEQEGKAQPEEE